MRAAGLGECELSLTLTERRAIRKLNRDFRGNDRPPTFYLSRKSNKQAQRRRTRAA